ncbi:MAG TPA: NAD-dependent epimerase/dehydratase family protein [Candidatus Limnocylindrales bacterium]|nr:NAD-dependent epimerase/dehydratase family protein [Candidatus Limnocylindrales bacterium]
MRTPYVPQRILFTGSTGTAGGLIAPALAALRAPVRLLLHRAAATGGIAVPPGSERRAGDLERPGTLRGVADGCDVVVHAAGRTGFVRFDRERQRRVNVAGTEALLREAAGSGVKVFVLIGYTGTVQERADPAKSVDEETPPEGAYESDYVRMKMEAEALVLEANGSGGMHTMVVSPGVLVAPRVETILGGLISLYAAGDLPYRILDEVWLAISDGRDLGRFVGAAIERGHGGRRYFATSSCIRLGDLYRLLHELTGVAPPRRRLPDLLVEELGLLTPVLPPHSFLRQLVLPRELVLHLRRLAPLRNVRTQADLDVSPTPIAETLGEMVRSRAEPAAQAR